MYSIPPTITKDYILSKITEEDIFERYLCPVTNGLIRSPLRNDSRPTCMFFRGRNGQILFNDFSGHFFGSCFEVVKFKYNVGFTEALYIIAKDFNLINGKNPAPNKIITTPKIELKTKILQVKRQDWTEVDKKYWKSFSLTSKILDKFKVSSCKVVWINGEIIYNYKNSDPGYIYDFGNGEYKIYFPFRKEYRFLGNSTSIQGWNQLIDKYEFLIITKSLKDVMVFDLFNIPAIATQAESVIPDYNTISNLKSRFNSIFSLYDFDKAGRRGAFKMYNDYNIPMLYLTNGRFNTKHYGAKDIADYIKLNGYEKTRELISETYNKII